MDDEEYSILAIEIAIRTPPNGPLRQQLRSLLASMPQNASPRDKQGLYPQLSRTIVGNMGAVERVCWDYFDDHDRAEEDFAMWCDGMTNAEGARRVPSFEPWLPVPDPLYMTFTMAFLLENGSPTDLEIRQRCDIPEDALWRRDNVARVITAVQALNFDDVISDVVYIIPNDDRFLLTAEDIVKDAFEHLRPLV